MALHIRYAVRESEVVKAQESLVGGYAKMWRDSTIEPQDDWASAFPGMQMGPLGPIGDGKPQDS